MDITLENKDKYVLLTLSGRLDATQVEALNAKIDEALAQSGKLLLDCGGLEYIASMGLRGLLMANKKAQAAGGGMALFGVGGIVEEVFSVSGFATLLNVAGSEAEAADLLA